VVAEVPEPFGFRERVLYDALQSAQYDAEEWQAMSRELATALAAVLRAHQVDGVITPKTMNQAAGAFRLYTMKLEETTVGP